MWPKLIIGMALRTAPGRRAARKAAVAGTVTAVALIAAAGVAGYLGYRWWEAREAGSEDPQTGESVGAAEADEEWAGEGWSGDGRAEEEGLPPEQDATLIAAELISGQ